MKSCSCEFGLICQLCFRFKKVCDLLFSTKNKKPEPARFLSRKWNFLIKEINWYFGRDKNSNYDAAGRTDLWSLTSLISVMGSLKSTLSGPRAEVLQWERMASNFLYYFREGRPSCSYSANRKRLQRFIHLFFYVWNVFHLILLVPSPNTDHSRWLQKRPTQPDRCS